MCKTGGEFFSKKTAHGGSIGFTLNMIQCKTDPVLESVMRWFSRSSRERKIDGKTLPLSAALKAHRL
jgi:hypothetical protein